MSCASSYDFEANCNSSLGLYPFARIITRGNFGSNPTASNVHPQSSPIIGYGITPKYLLVLPSADSSTTPYGSPSSGANPTLTSWCRLMTRPSAALEPPCPLANGFS